MDNKDGPKTLQTTATSIEILNLLEAVDGARVSEIADQMETPKSTVHGHLATLKEKKFVIQRGDFYYLGPELLRLGNQVRTRQEGFVLAREFTERLFEEVELRSIFAVEMGGKAVFIHTASGSKMGWMHEQLGNRLYLHNTAVGKAILAEYPKSRVEQILDEWGMPAETENTITDRAALFDELAEVRDQGYAVNRAENIKELHGIGVAATRQSGEVIGGFSVTGPEHSFTGSNREGQLADRVTEIINEYELELALA
ncbi:IclR family transcriptional regulator [Halorarum halophilum]|uniref:IclR family transcriptional regulator n=1 Tax=Halorarum halophilum TaxID=2743090 RepID=A0A7D5GDH1_9EURY|nr:IclR family transcriptional regulator [Halobaculum halophilum]QLG28972.1 IclR family transcriptional regulator [Halobaculum halophilum]